VTPLKLLKVIPTALAQNLQGRDMAFTRGGSGFLSMDQTRRLLVLAEEDPKAAQLPLVGIWVCGVESIHDPVVWTALMRYRNCEGLGERVSQNGSFLLLSYLRSAVLQPPDLAQVCGGGVRKTITDSPHSSLLFPKLGIFSVSLLIAFDIAQNVVLPNFPFRAVILVTAWLGS
jgi:hypothetical protein